jgi:steroid delta-isomerase-like uncharacterized protein
MRQLTIALCLCLAACGGQEPSGSAAPAVDDAAVPAATRPAVSKPPVVEESAVPAVAPQGPRKLLEDYLQAWNRHDSSAASAFLSDDCVFFDALLANAYHGRAEAKQRVVEMYLRAVPDGQWSLRGEPVVSADGFSFEWTLTGTNSGDWTSYLRAHGQKIDFKGISIVRLKDGKIAYQANYFDTNALGAQAGW